MKNKAVVGLVKRMTLDQKVGALLTLGFSGTVVKPRILDFIEKYHCGGLRLTPHARVFGSYVNPKTGESVVDLTSEDFYKKGIKPPYVTASDYKNILDGLQAVARKRPLGLPLHFSYDQEGGESANFCFGGAHLFPYPMGLRATGDPAYAYEAAKAAGRQSRAVGFSWVHSPVLDVNTDPRNPEIGIRAYSDDAEVVAEYALAACRGFKEARVIATGKHFPGRGHSAVDAHFELPRIDVDWDTMYNRELLPYRALIAEGLLPSIMIAHSVFPAIDAERMATVSEKVLTGLLREKLGFDGVIATDSMTMGALATRYGVPQACAMALEAGADLVLMKAENELVGETFEAIKHMVESGAMSEGELDRKVYRVLAVKYEYGLFHAGDDAAVAPEAVVNDPAVARAAAEISRKAIVVKRDSGGLLPLCKESRTLVIEQMDEERFMDAQNHPGMLFEHIAAHNRNTAYLETRHEWDDEDKARAAALIPEYDTIVITNHFIRGKNSNTDEIQKLAAGRNVVLVTNTPYDMTSPDNVGTVLVTFSNANRHSCKAAADVLYGAAHADGVWPLEN